MKHLDEYLLEQQNNDIIESIINEFGFVDEGLKDKIKSLFKKIGPKKLKKMDKEEKQELIDKVKKEEGIKNDKSFEPKIKTKDDFFNLCKLMTSKKLLNYTDKKTCESAFEYIINNYSFSPNKVSCKLNASSTSVIGLDASIEKLIKDKTCKNASFYNPETLKIDKMQSLDPKDLTKISKDIKNYAPFFSVDYDNGSTDFSVNHKNTISNIKYTVNDKDIVKNISTQVNYLMSYNNKSYNIWFGWNYDIIYKNGTFEKPSNYEVKLNKKCEVKIGAEHKVSLSEFFADMCKRLDIKNNEFKDIQDREFINVLKNIYSDKHDDFYINIYGVFPIILFMILGSYEFYKKWDYYVTH